MDPTADNDKNTSDDTLVDQPYVENSSYLEADANMQDCLDSPHNDQPSNAMHTGLYPSISSHILQSDFAAKEAFISSRLKNQKKVKVIEFNYVSLLGANAKKLKKWKTSTTPNYSKVRSNTTE